jgi:hypothetical protein
MKIFLLLATSLFAVVGARGNVSPVEQAARLLPDRVGDFRAIGPVLPTDVRFVTVTSAAVRDYRSANRVTLSVELLITASDSSAYALLSGSKSPANSGAEIKGQETRDIGTVAIIFPHQVFFFKGPIYVAIKDKGAHQDSRAMLALARQLAVPLDKGDGDVPVLVKHLPDWQRVEPQAHYAVDPLSLKEIVREQPVLDAVGFEGGTEAVTANYASSQLLIIEFTTPQLAGDNDWNIRAKIRELWAQGKPAPTAYRRVGNYSVFVFNGPDERTANQLIDQVKYEQVVQWLGDNPYWLKEAQRRYTETTLGVFISVLKASGIAALLCFGIGGFFGALLFGRRRAQQAAIQAYSDAGGMMRLNLDEMTAQTESARLIGPGVSDKL